MELLPAFALVVAAQGFADANVREMPVVLVHP